MIGCVCFVPQPLHILLVSLLYPDLSLMFVHCGLLIICTKDDL